MSIKGNSTIRPQLLPGLIARPQCHIIGKKQGVENVISDNKAMFVFIKDCDGLQVNITGKVGKITMEDVKNANISVSDNIVGGSFEVIHCANSQLNLSKNCQVPIVQITDSHSIRISIQEKSQLQNICVSRTHDIKLLLENQTVENESGLTLEYSIETIEQEFESQRMAHWSSALPDATLITESVVRDSFGFIEQLHK